MAATILIVADSTPVAARVLADRGHVVTCRAQTDPLPERPHDFDVVVCECRGATGLNPKVQVIRERWPSAELIVLCTTPNLDAAVSALRLGVREYLHLPTDHDRLADEVERAAARVARLRELEQESQRVARLRWLHREAERVGAVGSWEWNPATDELRWTNGMYRLAGRRPDEGPPSRDYYLSRIHPDDRDAVARAMQQLLHSADRVTVEYRFRRIDDDSERHFLAFKERSPGQDPDESRPVMVGTIHDITEQKLAEAARAESDAMFRKFLENTPAFAYVKDDQLIHRHASSALLEYVGMTPDEFRGTGTRDITGAAPDEAACVEALERKVLEENRPLVEDNSYVFRGRTITLREIKFPIAVDGGRRMIGGISVDLTEQKAREDELHLVVEAAGLGIWRHNPQDESTVWNDRLYEMYGVKPGEFDATTRGWREFIHPDDIEDVDNAIRRLHRGEKVSNVLFRADLPDGTRRVMTAAAHPVFDAGGQIIGWIGVNQDVTAVHESRVELAHREAMLKAIFENSLNPIVMADSDGRYRFANEAAARMLGYPVEQLLQMQVQDLVAANGSTTADRYRAYLDRGNEIGELSLRRPDGTTRHAIYHAIEVEPDLHLSILHDVTEERQQQGLARSVMDSLSAHVAVINGDGEIIAVNRAWEQMADEGGADPRMVGPGANYLAPVVNATATDGHAKRAADGIRQVLAGETPEFTMVYPCHAPGERRWFRLTATPLHGQGGAVIAHQNVTEQTLAAAEIERTRDMLDRTEQVARVGGWELDPVTNRLQWTRTTFEIHELDPANGEPTLDQAIAYFSGEGATLLRDAIDGAMAGQRWEFELPFITESGREIWVRTTGAPEVRDGKVVRLSGTLQDVDRRKRAELEVMAERASLADRVNQQTAQLQHALQVKDEFLANMSHELRTPLNAVMVLAESLGAGAYGEVSQRQIECIDDILRSGEHLTSLINDVLDLSRLEANRLELVRQPTSVSALVESSSAMVRDLATRKGLTLEVQASDRAPRIDVDERRMRQVLVNLLSNAIKFTASGTVRLEAAIIGNECEFVVTDTGHGIAPEQVMRMFEPFVQADSSLSRTHEGSGLGLAIVDRLVRLHDGSVDVESEPGVGSRFIVRLPLDGDLRAASDDAADVGSRSTPTLAAVPEDELPPRILLAEDNELNRRALSEFLHVSGYHVVLAENGQQALDRFGETEVDLVILDVQMPGMDGLQVTRRLRAMNPPVTTPIIALTGLAMSDDRQRCLDAGFDDYFAKPYSLVALQERIEQLLRRR